MEYNFLLDNLFKGSFWDLFSDFTYIAYIILLLAVFTIFILLLTVVYKKVRRKFPVRVNCWFCNNNSSVPYELSNCWDCPHCKQYNGFNKDGGYNKIIPEQFNSKLNENVFTNFKTSENGITSGQANGFCKLCNINQQLKIQQLALFVPLDENNYFQEIEQYREKLEKAYKLCSTCEKTLQETLQKQEYNILTNRLNSHKDISLSQKLSNVDKFGRKNVVSFIKNNRELGLKIVCIAISILLFLALLNHFETENQFLGLALPDFISIEPFKSVLEVLQSYIENIHSFKRELSFTGLVCWLLADVGRKAKKNFSCLVVWGCLHMLLWTTFTGPQVLLSGLCLFLSCQGTQGRFLHFSKKSLPKNSSFQSIKKTFQEFNYNVNDNYWETNPAFPFSSNSENSAPFDKENTIFANKVAETEQKFTSMPDVKQKKKKVRKTENEVEFSPNEENSQKEKLDSKPSSSSPNTSFNAKPTPLFMDSVKNNIEAHGGPFNEVYNTLNGLHIGEKQKKPNKPPNFLFSNSNFSEVKSSSIIKPAKFIKNLNSSSWTESNECNSRSSTPSSGYSSQKPEKTEPARYDFPKTMTPLSVNSFNRFSPNYFDPYDSNHLFYNNVNCFSPGFVPFQQYQNPVGHTAIFTCTRPTSFPFPCSPYQGFPPQKFSPGSSRFSDASDCFNLFQDTSKSFEKNKRWCKFKSFLYYFSIFLNITTVMTLVFFISTGVVLVDFNLPKFNFIV